MRYHHGNGERPQLCPAVSVVAAAAVLASFLLVEVVAHLGLVLGVALASRAASATEPTAAKRLFRRAEGAGGGAKGHLALGFGLGGGGQ